MTRFMVGDPIPASLTKRELADGLGVSERTIERLTKAHSHPAVKKLAGSPLRYDGRAVRTWLNDGERKFFAKAG